ncbi:hypothetical protein [Ohtaekwangia koreensis]|uniref:Uncharacterized protein n=1 Tax=Ohtaekwangia koreensis TaxID=688867 RepID=A0A1T5LP60_9BACT|nr:hypothetical protein [Ohtaekwangia koreensis]SKC77740.1 hypothetical protein SAMN05660236_3629 [Ohtaekwangia koreensis]
MNIKTTGIVLAVSITCFTLAYIVVTIKNKVSEKFALVDSVMMSDTLKTILRHSSHAIKKSMLLTNPESHYVGVQQTDSMNFVCNLDIYTIDSTSFHYTLNFQNESENFKTIEGIAQYKSASDKNYIMLNAQSDVYIPADIFIDRNHTLTIEISRTNHLAGTIARVRKTDGASNKALTPTMFYK